MRVRFSETEARNAIAAATNWSEALRLLEYVSLRWQSQDAQEVRKALGHLDGSLRSSHRSPARDALARPPAHEVLVRDSSINRGNLKLRLYREGLKRRKCELCGQTEEWRGSRHELILDHVNGDPRDNRLENLRIVCPNCAATLDTHCGKNFVRKHHDRSCAHCGAQFRPRRPEQRYSLAQVFSAFAAPCRCPPGRKARRAAALRATDARNRGDELSRRWAQIRRLRRRDTQVGPGV